MTSSLSAPPATMPPGVVDQTASASLLAATPPNEPPLQTAGVTAPAPVLPSTPLATALAVTPAFGAGSWGSRLTTNESGIKSTLANATLILTYDTDWQGVLGYDERAEEPVFLRPPPFTDCPPHLLAAPRPLVDTDDVRVVQWLEEKYQITVQPGHIHAAVNTVATNNSFDLVRNYLDSVVWDGVDRLDTWLPTYLGAEDSAYNRAVGAKWPISAAARTYEPGCKADALIVLEGLQGLGKSTAFETLAGEDNFGDDIPPIGSKDAQQYIGRLWIIELAEMDAASKAEAATLKRFLTTKVDRYRPPFGRRVIRHARRCVFAGSVNLNEYLKDPTGGRRFWPVSCTKVDVDGLRSVRDQLWAEAVERYRKGEAWHLDKATEELAREQQAKRFEADPWEDKIREWVATQSFVTTSHVLEFGLDFHYSRMTKVEKNRVGAVMQGLGWKYGEQKRVRGWHRPPGMVAAEDNGSNATPDFLDFG